MAKHGASVPASFARLGSGGIRGGRPSNTGGQAEVQRTNEFTVLVQKVQAAREAEGLDLFEEVLDGDAGVFTSAFAQVLAVGIDQAGTVLGDAEHALGPVGLGVAFDGVQGQLQAAGASSRPTPFSSRP
jgi:hypothetical protein